MHDRFEFTLRMTGPEWVEFRSKEVRRGDNNILHLPTGWLDGNVAVTQMENRDVQIVHYSGPLTEDALSLLELLVSYTNEAQCPPG